MSCLSLQQQAVLGFIGRYRAEHDRSPSLREIAEQAGISGISKAHRLVMELEERGLVRTKPGKWRSIVLVGGAA